MAVSDEIKQQHEKVKRMSRKQKFGYFMDYYKFPVLITIIIVICAVLIVRSIINNKPYAFYAIAVNSSPAEGSAESLQNDFSQYSDIDMEKYDCLVDTSSMLNFGGSSQYDIATQEKMIAVIATAELDVIVSDQTVFDKYVSNESFSDLHNYFSDTELDAMSDKLYYVDRAVLEAEEDSEYNDSAQTASAIAASNSETSNSETSNSETSNSDASAQTAGTDFGSILDNTETSVISKEDFVKPDPEKMADPVPVGIIVSDSSELSKCSAYTGTIPIAGILSNTKHADKAVQFIQFLLQ